MSILEQGSEVLLVGGEELFPLPNRCLYWAAEETLFVADIHLGKGASFRCRSVPVPSGSTQETLTRLDTAILEANAKRLVVLGDLWHAAVGRTEEHMDRFVSWRQSRASLSIFLVTGNHDLKSGPLPAAHNIDEVPPGSSLGPFELQHEPQDPKPGLYGLGGHLHPGVRLTGRADSSLTLPCFWFRSRYGVLPSFGEFTGVSRIRPNQTDEVFAVFADGVRRV
jgi:DNA ligase-associated metallophosphoesterase